MTLRAEPLTQNEYASLRGLIRARWEKNPDSYEDGLVAADAVQSEHFDGKMISAAMVKAERMQMGIDLRGKPRAPSTKRDQALQVIKARRGRKPGSKNIEPRQPSMPGSNCEGPVLIDLWLEILGLIKELPQEQREILRKML